MKAGIVAPHQARTADHAAVPISKHVAAYLEHLRARTVRSTRVSEKHGYNVSPAPRTPGGGVGHSRLAMGPLEGPCSAGVQSDRRRVRRALTR
ncbi:MAG: hypothetical protein ACYS8L_02265 [Planctomycetota bacterium]